MGDIKGLYAIVDNTFSPKYSHVELAHLILLGGCKILQLRIKGDRHACQKTRQARDDNPLWNQEAFDAARKIMEFKKKFDFTFIINDYVDAAVEVRADGIHVGKSDMDIKDVRNRVGGRMIIGYSSHSIDEALEAEKRGADYIAFGAIFPTKTKGPGHPVQGIEKLKELCSKIKKPIVAIGGINRSNIKDVISAGADAIAMITGITQANDVVEEIKWYMNKMTNYQINFK